MNSNETSRIRFIFWQNDQFLNVEEKEFQEKFVKRNEQTNNMIKQRI